MTDQDGDGGVDLESLLALREALVEEFVDLVETYLQDSPRKIARLDAAFAARDKVRVKEAVHSLKGSSSNLAAVHLARLCEDLENRVDTLEFDRIAQWVEQIKDEYTKVAAILARYC